jgi:MscS family membrane protein
MRFCNQEVIVHQQLTDGRSVAGRASACVPSPLSVVSRALLAALMGVSVGATSSRAQSDSTGADTSQGAAATPAVPSPGSPRHALEQYLSLARAGRSAEAAAYLDLSDTTQGPALARRLKAVLDRYLWIDLDRVSSLTVGDTADGLPPGVDQLGTIRGLDGVPVPIRLTRTQAGSEVPWRFTRATVLRVPALYATLPDRWVLEHLPPVLLRPGPFELLWWQWLSLPVLIIVSVVLGAVISRLARAIIGRIVVRTRVTWDDAVLSRLGGPLTAAATLVLISALVPWLSLYRPAAEATYRVIRVGLFITFFWSLWRLVDVARDILSRTRWALASASSRALLPLGGRVTKVIVLAIAAVAVLSILGYPVASLIAGLGIGGLAFALAAQKTVENLFGAFSIGVDQPFREGDFVKIDDFVGTVEQLGLRSTRFRTLDRTLITIPNGRLADMRLESFAARDRLRLATVIGLVYETTAAQMREVLAGLERVLRAHPRIWPDVVVVRFREFAASSLDIEIMAWFQTRDWGEFQLIRQDVLLQFMEVVETAGSSFAFPTQTIHLGNEAVEALGQGNGSTRSAQRAR